MTAGDPRERLHAWLHEKGNAHLDDAVENASLTITGGDTSRATVKVPADAAGKSFHVICEVTDNGTPPLTAYRRVIVAPPGR